MNWSYVFKHWGNTLLLGAILFIISFNLKRLRFLKPALLISCSMSSELTK